MNPHLHELFAITKTKRLLYVEDNEEVRGSTLDMLKRFFGHTSSAENGYAGLEMYRSQPFDFIITDINMPKMNGLEMISQIQKIDPDIPTIILTAHNEAKFYEDARQLGLEHYICKPLTLKSLMNTLSTIYIDNLQKGNQAT